MRLHEAIEKAGPGKPFRVSSWEYGQYWYINPEGKIMNGENNCEARITKYHFDADDWEVVEPEQIEVGDTVNACGQDKNGKAVAISDEYYYIPYMEDEG